MSVMHYLQDKTFQDIVKNLVLPFLSIIIIPLVKWFVQHYGYAPNIRKYRFEKIPVSEKESLLARIDKLTKESATGNTLVKIKLCYEQMGIYLPVWHCNQLIRYMSDQNICSMDVRLYYFLKYPVLGMFSDNDFSINSGRVYGAQLAIFIFGILSSVILIISGWSTMAPFSQGHQTVLYHLFFLIYLVIIFLTIILACNTLMEIKLAVQFGRLFEAWLKSERESPEQLALF
ncbi:TPA: type VI secretion protein [Escherichia coli]|uniref:type VI secretion protein n=1 Tax=Escherichia coli TaxID=562 RepID=UPI0005441894|nr:type VI secretion protein [Escherichia coli]EHT5186191.1 type VI secretion protein [Escherichia coli]EIH0396783.1 type VI secretion protein [Escherichia coli]EIL1431064.1 type VI secretion protein [Escherichia coli]EJN0439423.1 type VI secretion protein [Escherichia coli]EJX3023339.1 type VI secretion protein [Escherichia coli]